MQEKPKISVIVPVHNTEKYLRACVDSILAQTYGNIELILIDDGSTDQSGSICDEYASEDRRVKVVHNGKASGVSAARNIGLNLASGDYLAFVDSDDYVSEKMFEVLLQNIVQNDADVALCDYYGINRDGEVVKTDVNHKPVGAGVVTTHDALKALVANFAYVVFWNKIYKRRLFDSFQLPENIRIGEDGYVMPEIFFRSQKIIAVPTPLYYYRNTPNSATQSKFSIDNISDVDGRIRMFNFLEKHNYNDLLDETSSNILSRYFKFHAYFSPTTASEKEICLMNKREVGKIVWKYRKNIKFKELLFFESPTLFTFLQKIKNSLRSLLKIT